MSEWRATTIGEISVVFDGPHATPKIVEEGPIFLGIDALQNGRLVLGKTRHVSEEDYKTWTKRVTPTAGDLVFSYETRLGEAAIIPEGLTCCLGRRMGLLRMDKTQIIPEFLLYLYISPNYQSFLKSRTIHGATVDRLALKEFPDFPVRLPALDRQKAILKVLKTLDDKIELNRQMNETLEAMARALFQDWFVDFGPTRRKIAGEIKSRQRTNIVEAKAFSDRLQEAVARYHANTITSLEMIQELIDMAKDLNASAQRGEELGMSQEELAFYDALAQNDSAVEIIGNDELRLIANELVDALQKNVTVDWHIKESARAKLRLLVKKILKRHGYPPDLEQAAIGTVLSQAETLLKWRETSN